MPQCSECAHFDDRGFRAGDAGVCHRYPPIPHPAKGDGTDFNWAYWPVVAVDARCGEFKAKADEVTK